MAEEGSVRVQREQEGEDLSGEERGEWEGGVERKKKGERG